MNSYERNTKSYSQLDADKEISLLKIWSRFSSPQEREWWVKSLPLDQRALITKALANNPKKLF
jgi:hypothetical protein